MLGYLYNVFDLWKVEKVMVLKQNLVEYKPTQKSTWSKIVFPLLNSIQFWYLQTNSAFLIDNVLSPSLLLASQMGV